MNIYVTGINFKTANLELREQVSFTKSGIKEILQNLKKDDNILGGVLLCTCNRTELYITTKEKTNPVKVLCTYANVDIKDFRKHIYCKEGKEALNYLFELTCGFHSMIFGEDQILTQVKEALVIAKEAQGADATLSTLFRYAITSAKKVKTNVTFKRVNPSVASATLELLLPFINDNKGAKALIIGNGEIGRLMCEELINSGVDVTLTLRTYRHGETVVPFGCKTIDYYKREDAMANCNILISATASAHHTVSYDMIASLKNKPNYIIDLAVPRDIEPKVQEIEGVKYYDVDSIGKQSTSINEVEIQKARKYIDEELKRFYDWQVIHSCAGDISQIKQMAVKSISAKINDDMGEKEKIEYAITKTVDFILYSLKENASDQMVIDAINSVARRV